MARSGTQDITQTDVSREPSMLLTAQTGTRREKTMEFVIRARGVEVISFIKWNVLAWWLFTT